MRTSFLPIVGMLGILLSSRCTRESSPLGADTEERQSIVVQAFIYAGEPVNDIRVTSSIPLGIEDQSAEPINDAQVFMTKNGIRYAMQLSPGDSGYYRYTGNDLTIVAEDELQIEVQSDGETVSGETMVPSPPVNMRQSKDYVTVSEGFGFGGWFGGDTTNIRLTATWDNSDGSLYYITVHNTESNPQQIDRDTTFFRPRAFISQPTSRNNYVISALNVTHYGRHVIKLYHVNQEYADLYASRSQSSRDLNEPLTNLKNGLGIFTAFNSDSLFFNAVSE